MLVCLINQPALLEHVAEELAALTFSTDQLDRLRQALVEIAANHAPLDRNGLRAALTGYASDGEIDALLLPAGWKSSNVTGAFARPDASYEAAESGFRHVAMRHRRAAIEADLRAAEAVLADTSSEEALAHLVALRHQLHDIDTAQEATIGDGG
jgi:DNA primase